ncbi:MAG: efflux RND transporter periplasmic adaptor subunit [Deltaproteobacteria bacterium]|nr:efflux RND transporter periplasmic adaptor subunit [Deltaproteobacteria bacterium]
MKNLTPSISAMMTAALFLMALSGCGDQDSLAQPDVPQEQARTVKVSIVEVGPTPIKDILVLPGETEAYHDVLVGADTGGRVEWIGPREGDAVKKGHLLAKIDVSALKAALDRAQASLDLADDLYKRRKKLFERKIINREELNRSKTELTLAKSALRQARVEYERGFLRSPITGRVNKLLVDAGEFIDRGKPMVDLVNVDRIKIHVNVPELDVRYLKKGQEARVMIDAYPGRHMPGRIDFVAYKADAVTKTFRVQVLIENPNHDIRPGMIARVAFMRRIIPDALVAPLFALVDKGGERMVFVERDGVVQARTVSIGIIEEERVQIVKGLEAGDRLIVTGQTEVEEGMKVQVR